MELLHCVPSRATLPANKNCCFSNIMLASFIHVFSFMLLTYVQCYLRRRNVNDTQVVLILMITVQSSLTLLIHISPGI